MSTIKQDEAKRRSDRRERITITEGRREQCKYMQQADVITLLAFIHIDGKKRGQFTGPNAVERAKECVEMLVDSTLPLEMPSE